MKTATATLVLDGLVFPECPRWAHDRLWVTDLPAKHLLTVRDGVAEVFAEFPTWIMGTGFLPDGSILVVSMEDCRLLRHHEGRWSEAADLSGASVGFLNDLVVDGHGRAYASNTGRDSARKTERKPATIVLSELGSPPRVVATGLQISNGLTITADQRTLIVAETLGGRLTAYTIESDGSLTDQRVFADLGAGAAPNGICADAEGAVWVAVHEGSFLRVRDGGEILDRIVVPGGGARMAIACMLGGPDRRQLFLTSAHHIPDRNEMFGSFSERTGRVDVVTVDVPGAGWP